MTPLQADTLSDEEILSGCHAGRESAFQQFIDRFSGLVHWSVWKYTEGLNSSEREEVGREVFQDFFLQLVDKRLLGSLKEVSRLRKFIVVTVTHMTQNKLRQRRRLTAWERPLDDGMSGCEAEVHIQDDLKARQLDLLNDVMEELSPKEKAILDFCYGEGMTHEDIGILLAISKDTVSTVIRRSKEKIRKKMMENEN